ncbi:MAG TPA: Error-prone repair protein ImuA [Puia sp.]
MTASKKDIILQLQKDILPLQGLKAPSAGSQTLIDLGPIDAAFPNGHFPTAAIHEFLTATTEQSAATSGFIAGLVGALMQGAGVAIWISTSRTIFPAALKTFGIQPDRIIFIDLKKAKDALWAMEEALKCNGLAAVIGEIRDLDFTASRRLQLAVEQSRVTGFILRHQPRQQNTIACIARWAITPQTSQLEDNMPGIGFPRWQVQLLKIRNGKPGTWQMEWSEGRFQPVFETIPALIVEAKRKTG